MSSAHFKDEKLELLPLALVIGGAGFIGSHLCETLLKKNLKVVCLDNLTTGKKENLKTCLENPAFSFLDKDINSGNLLENLKPEYIFHLAGVEEYINGVDVSLETLLVNSLGTKNILDLAKKAGSKLLLVSSLSVYEGVLSGSSLKDDFGTSAKDAQKYTHHEAKRFSEALVAEYFRKFEINARVVRIKDCYGPRMSLEEGSALSKFFKEAVTGEVLTLENEGLEVLHPTYISDLITGVEIAMFAPDTNGKIYSLVNPAEITHLNFVSALQRQNPRPLKIAYFETKPDFRFHRIPGEIKKTQIELGWSPETSLESGIKKTLDFFNENIIKEKPFSSPEPDTSGEGGQSSHITQISPISPISQPSPAPQTPQIPQKMPSISTPEKPTLQTHTFYEDKPLRAKHHKNIILKKLAFLGSLLLLFVFVVLPFLYLSLRIGLGVYHLNSAKNSLEKGNTYQGKTQSVAAQKNFLLAKNTLGSLDWFTSVFKQRNNRNLLNSNLEIGEKASLVVLHSSGFLENLTNLQNLLENNQGEYSGNLISNSRLELSEIDKNLALIQALNAKQPLSCPFFVCQKFIPYISQIPELRSVLGRGDKILSITPDILGAKDGKSYLLLFQNNMEIRGGGGFLGSYGLLKLENGKITGLKIDDIYSLDGNLKGKVTPPDEILHYLGQPNWYLRDSNLEADFPLNAKRALWFLEKEGGVQADGVIALDLNTVQKILTLTGPLKIPDYDKKITAQNLFEIAEAESEVNFFPGSTQKKDFLGSLGRALLNEILKNQNKYLPSLLIALNDSIDEKHLQLYSADAKIQSVVETIGAGGEIQSPSCSASNGCLASPLLVTDNNFGANKVNLFLKRDLTRTLTLGKEGEAREKLSIVYENKSPAETWPGGPYKNMLKIYAPLGSKLLSMSIGDEKTATVSSVLTEDVLKDLGKDEFLVYESTQSGKTVWTTEVLVPVQKAKTVEVLYELPEKISYQGDSISLNIFQQKQAGTDKDTYSLSVGYPSFLKVKETAPQKDVIANPQLIRYNTTLSTDQSFKIDFTR